MWLKIKEQMNFENGWRWKMDENEDEVVYDLKTWYTTNEALIGQGWVYNSQNYVGIPLSFQVT